MVPVWARCMYNSLFTEIVLDGNIEGEPTFYDIVQYSLFLVFR
jgi:hypothetical protein